MESFSSLMGDVISKVVKAATSPIFQPRAFMNEHGVVNDDIRAMHVFQRHASALAHQNSSKLLYTFQESTLGDVMGHRSSRLSIFNLIRNHVILVIIFSAAILLSVVITIAYKKYVYRIRETSEQAQQYEREIEEYPSLVYV